MKSFVVIGLGRFGGQLAVRLYEQGSEVLAIDSSEELVEDYADYVTQAVTADATDREVLRKLGVQDCDCAVVSIASDLASSVLITMNLKSLGVPRIICKAHDDTHKEILQKLGADEVVLPEWVVADKLAKNLVSQNLLEYIELSADFGIVERQIPAAWCGKTVLELNIRAKYGLNLIAVKRESGIAVSPGARELLREGDVLVLLGSNESFRLLDKIR